MAHSHSGGTPNINSTDGTMVGVPTPGGNNVYSPKGSATPGTQVHGDFPDGGSEKVMPMSQSGSLTEWVEAGGDQQVKPA